MEKRFASQDRRLIEDELFLERCEERLSQELGVNQAGIEVILHMRQELCALQDRLRAIEAELSYIQSARGVSRIRYESLYYEASWYELEDPDEE